MDVGVKRWETDGKEDSRRRMCVAPVSVMRGEESEARRVGWGEFGQRLPGWLDLLNFTLQSTLPVLPVVGGSCGDDLS